MELFTSENGYTRTETEDTILYKTNKPNKNGFIINVTFTKNQKEHEESIEAIEQFFIREVL